MDIIEALELTGKLLDLHDGNPFKVKAYANAAYKLDKLRYDFEGKSESDINAIEGIGKGIAKTIIDSLQTGQNKELSELLEKTPSGVIDLLGIKGLGPKKVKQLWHELEIESIGELLYACNENRLTGLKGFGEKTQSAVKQAIEFKLANSNKFHFASIELIINNLIDAIREKQPELQIYAVGELARKCEIITMVEILMDGDLTSDYSEFEKLCPLKINYTKCNPDEFYYKLVQKSSNGKHLQQIGFDNLTETTFYSEEEVYESLELPYIEPELREGLGEVELARNNALPELIEYDHLRGALHNHTTYSDGVHTLKEMADFCILKGYEYFGVCDHSKTAVYANGLSIEHVLKQHREIDELNKTYNNQFKIFKGIESDILGDGSLDYPEEILKQFDFIVASVHSNLKMNEERATERLIKAIENPYTTILGHPTGRLLLSRPGYPINHKKVIDACAANNVCIELNAHPYRLDIDWRWIPYCLTKGVLISINPDAHHKDGLLDMYYGVCAARKGMLTKEDCLNTKTLTELSSYFSSK